MSASVSAGQMFVDRVNHVEGPFCFLAYVYVQRKELELISEEQMVLNTSVFAQARVSF